VNESTENPYAAPQVVVEAELDSLLDADERIHFAGTVDRSVLRQALRPRLSWSFLAIFMVGALVCCAAAGPDFLTPWRKQIFYRDFVEDLLGVMGLGLFVLAVAHILSAVFGIDSREKRVLSQSPNAYGKVKSGYISAECLYLKESDGEAWLSWTSVGHFQFGHQVLLVDWVNGASGGTVLTQDMFSSASEFERVHRIFNKQVSLDQSQHRLREMPDYFSTNETLDRQPAPDECVAESRKELTHGEAFRYVMGQLPRAMAISCWPLHAYFGLMLVIALAFTRHRPQCMLLILCAWFGIVCMAICISVMQHRHLYFRGRERLLNSRIMFTPQEVHFQMTGTYGILQVGDIVVNEATEDEIFFCVEDAAVSSSFDSKNFGSEEEWMAVRKLLVPAKLRHDSIRQTP